MASNHTLPAVVKYPLSLSPRLGGVHRTAGTKPFAKKTIEATHTTTITGVHEQQRRQQQRPATVPQQNNVTTSPLQVVPFRLVMLLLLLLPRRQRRPAAPYTGLPGTALAKKKKKSTRPGNLTAL